MRKLQQVWVKYLSHKREVPLFIGYTCDKINTGFFRSILAMPISPLARPLPSTIATMTLSNAV